MALEGRLHKLWPSALIDAVHTDVNIAVVPDVVGTPKQSVWELNWNWV
jgi:hypothetical protein